MNNFNFNHVAGCILGGAIGDAFGIPVEFKKWNKIEEIYGPNGLTEFIYNRRSGLTYFSDDTAQTVFTADGLLKSIVHSGYAVPPSMEIVHRSYRDWYFICIEHASRRNGWITQWRDLGKATGGGKTCINVLSGTKMGTANAPLNDSPTCGGVMRSAPCGLIYWEDSERAFQTACDCTLITHGHADAYLSAGVYAAIIAELIQGKTIPEAVNASITILKKRQGYKNTLDKLNQAIKLVSQPIIPREAISQIGLGYLGTECIAVAVYCALKTPNDFRQTILNSVNHSGDSDTVGSVAGGIVGAYLGRNAIPVQWLQHLSLESNLEILSRDILAIPKATDMTKFAQRYPA